MIRLENASKHYGAVVAVADVTLTIERGQFVTLLGPSGSGKTTTMRMIAGLEKPTAGKISIGGSVVSGKGIFVPPYRRRLGMVFQSYAVWPHKTVQENIAFPLQQRRMDRAEQRARVHRMLVHVGLVGYGDRYPSQLSGGQQQRVSLARALVAEPDVILFDEPLSNLDAQLRDSMRELLSDLHKDLGTTSVYVTHDQTEAMVLSDRIHVMKNGRIVQSGTPEDLYERPTNRFVADFIGAANVLAISSIDREATSVVVEGGGLLRVARIENHVAENILVVRPHHLRFAPESESENVIPATIHSISYLGDRIRYVAEIARGTSVAVETDARGLRAERAERVRVFFPAESCVVI